jgi:prepilin-type N-terminal cleavage/methylation domain-containing protein
MSAATVHAGVTLIELLVVLVILGALAGVVGLSWGADGWGGGDDGAVPGPRAAIAEARRQAVATGRATTVTADTGGGAVWTVTALPDGRVLGAGALDVDPLSGRPATSTTPADSAREDGA